MAPGDLEKFGSVPKEEQIPKIPEVEAFQKAVIEGGGRVTNTYVMKNGYIPLKEIARLPGRYGEKLLNCLQEGLTTKEVKGDVVCTPGDFVNAMAHVQNITADKIHFETKFWGGNFEWWAVSDEAEKAWLTQNSPSREK